MKKHKKSSSDQSVSFKYTTETGCQNAGMEFIFSASQTGYTEPVEYSWNFGYKNATAKGKTVTYTYSNPGEYSVVLTIKDANGATGQCTKTVVVDSP